MAINLYASRVILAKLGVEDFGIYNVVGGVVTMMAFLNTSLTSGFQRFFNIALGKEDDEEFKKLFSVSIACQLLLALLVLLLTESIGLCFLENKMTIPETRMVAARWVYQSAIVVFFITLFTSPLNAVVISIENMNIYALISILQSALKLGVVYMIDLFDSDRLIIYSLLIVVVDFIVWLFYFFSVRKKCPELRFKPDFDRPRLKKIVSFSGWNLFGSCSHMLKSQGINIVLNMFFDPAINAARGIAYQVMSGVKSFYGSFQTAARPQSMKYYAKGEQQQMIKLSYDISRLSFMLLWIITLPLLFTTKYILEIWLRPNMPDYAPVFTQIILLTSIVEVFGPPIATIVHATGKMKKYQLVCGFTIMLIVPIAYLFLKIGYPPESAMYVSLAMLIVVHLIRLLLVKELVDFSIADYIKKCIVPCIFVGCASLVIPLMLFLFRINNLLHPFIMFAICLLCGCVSIWLIGLSKNEKDLVINKITKKISK
ncbi:MAG: lipopolysaccharide biosynthesis protein [Bacteroidales bacterium]|nr:lipopolysaccharide biosynthesis protein [Bacteroidales bacterium]